MDHRTIAYLIIALCTVALGAAVAFNVYNSRARVYRRRRLREIAEHEAVMAERGDRGV